MDSIKALRTREGLSQKTLAEAIGVSRSTVAMWETGASQPDNDSLQLMADYFNVSTDYLLGRNAHCTNLTHRKKGIKIPVLGEIRAGVPVEAIEEILDYEEITEEMARQGEFFALRIQGDSMEPRIKEGDVVIVLKQSDVESGQVAIVLVNGEDATCKKFVKHEDGISLVSFNQAYDPMFYTWKEAKELPIDVLGKVVELRGKF